MQPGCWWYCLGKSKRLDLDEDIKRVIAYIHAHGFKVRYSRAKKRQIHTAEVDFTDMVVTVWLKDRNSKKEKLMHLLHEAGHICDWVGPLNRCPASKLGKFLQEGRKHTQEDRFELYLFENLGILAMEEVRKMLGLSIPKKEVTRQRRLDVKPYRIYWKTGKFPR